MLNEATILGYNTFTSYNNFHVFTEETDSIYLSEDELMQLKEYNFEKSPCLEHTRDWFLLLAWTGSRFSDLEKIVRTDIKGGTSIYSNLFSNYSNLFSYYSNLFSK